MAVEGDPVAGLPSASVQTEAGLPSGGTITIDIVAFGDDGGSYIIVGQNQLPAMVPRFREVDLPAILESVTLGES